MRLVADHGLHTLGILALGALATRRPDGRSATAIENLGLKGGGVGVDSHFAAQGIELVNEMTFGETSDSGVARHACNRINAGRNEEGGDPHSGCSEASLRTGMTSADDNQIIIAVHMNEEIIAKLSTVL